jgi:hypothetical protein
MDNNKNEIILSLGKLTCDILIGVEVFAFKACESMNLFQNLSKPTIYEILNDACIQITNHVYHNIRNRSDERVNELCDEIRKHIIIHDHCLIILLIRIMKSIHNSFDRTSLNVIELEKKVKQPQTIFDIYMKTVVEQIANIYDGISEQIFKSLKPCNDECYIEYDESKNPFNFMLHET